MRQAYLRFRQRCRTADEDASHVCGQGEWPGGCKRYGVLRAAWETVNGTFMIWQGK
jgi:hypothetical protein